MSLFTDASLVMIPSGIKDQKIYSVTPTDGSGDLTFTRSNDTATRVASNGLIERVRTNNLPYSEAFDNAAWIKNNGASVVANDAANPLDGALTADRLIIPTTASSRIEQIPPTGWATSGQLITLSCYIKGFSGSGIVGMRSGIVGDSTLWSFNSSTWTRVTWTKTAGSNYEIPQFCNATLVAGADASVDILAFGFQIELGDIATDYIATTSAAVSVGPVANLPRLDYSGGASCPRLILEGQRTNLYNYSEQLDQWLTSSATVTANYAVSPDGYTNADRVQFAAGGLVYVSGTGSAGENTLSVYAKATNGVSAKFSFFGNGAVTYSSDQTATGEWQRFTFTYTYSAVTAGLSIATTGADDVIFYGFQHEVGTYATSYIPTLGSASTRGSESASKTSASALIGQTEGTVFVEFKRVPKGVNYQAVVTLQGASSAYLIEMYFDSANTLLASVYNSGAQFQSVTSALSEGTYKAALAYKENDFAFYLNGVQISTDNSGTVPALSTFNLGDFTYLAGFPQNDGINQALLFKTRLSNADLAALTA
jgi:hypothetical protein